MLLLSPAFMSQMLSAEGDSPATACFCGHTLPAASVEQLRRRGAAELQTGDACSRHVDRWC